MTTKTDREIESRFPLVEAAVGVECREMLQLQRAATLKQAAEELEEYITSLYTFGPGELGDLLSNQVVGDVGTRVSDWLRLVKAGVPEGG